MTYVKLNDSLVQRLNDGSYLAITDPAYQAWLTAGHTPIDCSAGQPVPVLPSRQLPMLDYRMARFGEDLLNALVTKGVLAVTDLPAAVQSLLTQRQALRSQITSE